MNFYFFATTGVVKELEGLERRHEYRKKNTYLVYINYFRPHVLILGRPVRAIKEKFQNIGLCCLGPRCFGCMPGE